MNSNGECVDDSHYTKHKATVPLQQQRHTKSNHLNSSSSSSTDTDDVIRVLINGQPARFSANTINLSHSHNNVGVVRKTPHNNDKSSSTIINNTDKLTNNNTSNTSNCSGSNKSSSNAYDKSFDAMKQSKQTLLHSQKYSDDAMHLPDIVVGSTLHVSNINTINNNTGSRKPIPLSRSPPKIVVNDNTLDSWSSNDEETGSLGDSFDEESTEVDEDTSELTDVSVAKYFIHSIRWNASFSFELFRHSVDFDILQIKKKSHSIFSG